MQFTPSSFQSMTVLVVPWYAFIVGQLLMPMFCQSKYVEAIGILEELLKVKKAHFGTTSKEFTRTCKQLCEICNILAVYYLKKEDINSALDLLKKSEELCENNELGQAMTFNNMACYYRRIGKMRTALNFL